MTTAGILLWAELAITLGEMASRQLAILQQKGEITPEQMQAVKDRAANADQRADDLARELGLPVPDET